MPPPWRRTPERLLAGLLAVTLLVGLLPWSAPARTPHQDLNSHRDRLGVSAWLKADVRGRGVTVAVLDADFAGYKAQLGKTLPGRLRVRVKSFRDDGSIEAGKSQHGLRAAQVIHALAPGADLLLVNWEPSSPARFLDAVRWARAEGAQVISCSVTAAGWGDGEGGGPNHRRLATILGPGSRVGQPLFVCSAGNMARGHWGGAFARGPDRFHQWRPGQADNALAPDAKGTVKLNVIHPAGTSYELRLYEGDSKMALTRAETDEAGTGVPGNWLTFTAKPGRKYRIRLRHVRGPEGTFHVVARGATLDVTTRDNSVCCFPADNAAALTVGAVDWDGRRAWYSAYGGTAKGPAKPELVAPVPFPCPGRPDGFNGTSAAAPQVAGLAALLLEKHPKWTAAELRKALIGAAVPAAKSGTRRVSLPKLP